MKYRPSHFLLSIVFALLTGCGNNKNETKTNQLTQGTDSLRRDSLVPEIRADDNIVLNDSLTDQLKPIRENFKRINAIARWTKIDSLDLWETTEGGEAKFYYAGNNLEKISVRHFGETFQQLAEYYLLNGQLSFVFEKAYRYNRPMYYDSVAMKESGDTEAFDFDKSIVVENRGYFKNEKLVHQINNDSSGSPDSGNLPDEEKRIKTEFGRLMKLQGESKGRPNTK